MKSQKICSLLFTEIAVLTTFATQIPPANAQSITDKSCIADIIGEDMGSQVNIRSGAGTIFDVIGTVSVGNLVIVANDDQEKSGVVAPLSRKDSEGKVWYLTTRFRASPYKGWIREDFLKLRCPYP
ncbi:SH3 domain-containing protein [Pseudanabaena sp. FACHB-1998]|uniref:SH3 domain-containing protein n=1 Tax=Pseudanabaena sp. FACHB-1998 TaxID=2692858 RepID=UPI0016803023|nr:SH3 domain-containing protein [Pseudanabaena sp. FACHB-1998]MBD2176186.1 SH3 domain-containing protein [Pseudanabaena sp. FACHB-1998]